MKKSGVLLVIIGIVVVVGVWMAGGYNSLVSQSEQLDAQWNQVETQYQRRVDLIPNLVSTVSGAANFEQETLTAVTEARTRWLNASGREEQVDAAQDVQSALSRLLVTVESYPQLQATQAFRDLMVQLEGTENRVATARRDYNLAVQSYNLTVRRFPGNILAGIFGFDVAEGFEADEGAEDAPSVSF